MHKGRQYPLEGMARVYSAQAPYPFWWPAQFEMRVDGFDGPYVASVLSTTTVGTYSDIDRATGQFEYAGVIPSTGGKIVELVLYGTLNPAGDNIITQAQVRVDGVDQIVMPLSLNWTGGWRFGQRVATISTPVGGAFLWWGGYWECEAISYPP